MTGRRRCSRVRRRVGATLRPLVRNRPMGDDFSGVRCRRWTPVRIRRARTANNRRLRTDRVPTWMRNLRVRLCPKKKKKLYFCSTEWNGRICFEKATYFYFLWFRRKTRRDIEIETTIESIRFQFCKCIKIPINNSTGFGNECLYFCQNFKLVWRQNIIWETDF